MADIDSAKTYLIAPSSAARGKLLPDDTFDAELASRERQGAGAAQRPEGPLIWMHSGDDPDAFAARGLARRIQQERSDVAVLLTTDADRRRRDDTPPIYAQLAPNDSDAALGRFFGYWRPSLSVWTEPAMRPALVSAAIKRSVPLMMFDANTADIGAPDWRPWRRGQSGLLEPFAAIVTGDPIRAESLRRIGAQPGQVAVMGYLQEGTGAPSCNSEERDATAADLSGRPTWLAARVGEAEVDQILRAQEAILERAHRMLLILVPDREADGPRVKARAEEMGMLVGLRSEGDDPDQDIQVYVADLEGELGLWYRIASVSFLGQSLSAGGGMDPYPAAALGSAILHGPQVSSYRGAFDRLAAGGASRLVHSVQDITRELDALLAPDIAAMRAHAAWRIASAGAEVTDHAIDLILTELDRQEAR
ncbi:MAG: glycosyltransferase N-terminal domain-containing protein [Pseudomonadota bacterium]